MDITQPQESQTQPASQEQPQIIQSNGSKKIITMTAVLIVLILIAGGLMYLNQKQATLTSTPQNVDAFDDLKNELDSANVGAKESDLDGVDQDLQDL